MTAPAIEPPIAIHSDSYRPKARLQGTPACDPSNPEVW
jgi:hypothetical protein